MFPIICSIFEVFKLCIIYTFIKPIVAVQTIEVNWVSIIFKL